MTARGKGEPKTEPRSIDLHALALDVRAFIVPIGTLPEASRRHFAETTELVVGLDLTCETTDGERQFGVILGPALNPCELAGELDGCGKTIIERIAVGVGLDVREARQHAATIARQDRAKARRQTLEHAPQNVTCDRCGRPVAVIVDGERLCKRHAEELGVRPHGKIGDDSP